MIVIFIPTGAADTQGVAESIRLGRAEAKSGREKPLLASFMGARGMGSPLAGPQEEGSVVPLSRVGGPGAGESGPLRRVAAQAAGRYPRV